MTPSKYRLIVRLCLAASFGCLLTAVGLYVVIGSAPAIVALAACVAWSYLAETFNARAKRQQSTP